MRILEGGAIAHLRIYARTLDAEQARLLAAWPMLDARSPGLHRPLRNNENAGLGCTESVCWYEAEMVPGTFAESP